MSRSLFLALALGIAAYFVLVQFFPDLPVTHTVQATVEELLEQAFDGIDRFIQGGRSYTQDKMESLLR